MYCIGLMSGTSVDGIDAALVEITQNAENLQVKLIAGETYPYPNNLRKQVLEVCGGAALSLAELAELDDEIATEFAQAAKKIQGKNHPVQLIGSHGQTVFHRTPIASKIGYSLQLGRGEAIANSTGILTVSNFRLGDIAAGGQGAPLVPKVDAYLLGHPQYTRCVQNIGGISNVTYLPNQQQKNWEQQVRGWDTGPGNVLIDLAIQKLTKGKQSYDKDGSFASQGTPCQPLIEEWLGADFFQQPPPKSTGRELFGEAYLERCWQEAEAYQLSNEDWLATLTELTVASIVHSYRTFLLEGTPDEVLLCGGGSRNLYLKQRLKAHLGTQSRILTTDEVGLNSNCKEAIAFAVLAYWRVHDEPGNLPLVTGAKQPRLLGEVHQPILRAGSN